MILSHQLVIAVPETMIANDRAAPLLVVILTYRWLYAAHHTYIHS